MHADADAANAPQPSQNAMYARKQKKFYDSAPPNGVLSLRSATRSSTLLR